MSVKIPYTQFSVAYTEKIYAVNPYANTLEVLLELGRMWRKLCAAAKIQAFYRSCKLIRSIKLIAIKRRVISQLVEASFCPPKCERYKQPVFYKEGGFWYRECKKHFELLM